MKNNFWLSVFLILLSVLVLTACGTKSDDDNSPQESETEENQSGDGSSEGIVAGAMEPSIEKVDDVTYRYTLVNQTEQPHTFEFTSSQRYDFSLVNEKGEQVFLFSSVSTYLQVMGEESVDQGDKLSYEFAIPSLDLEPGTYQVTAWLTPQQGGNYEASMAYVVE